MLVRSVWIGVVLAVGALAVETDAAPPKRLATTQEILDAARKRAAGLPDRVLPELRFNDNALDDVTDFLADVTGVNMYVDWARLGDAGVTPQMKVTFQSKNEKFRACFDKLLGGLLGALSPPKWNVVDEYLILSTADGLAALTKQLEADAKKESSAALKAKLDGLLPEVRFRATKFSDAIDFLRNAAGIKLSVDWETLAAAGVKRDAPVTMQMSNLTPRGALRFALHEAGGDKLDFTIDQDQDMVVIHATPAKQQP